MLLLPFRGDKNPKNALREVRNVGYRNLVRPRIVPRVLNSIRYTGEDTAARSVLARRRTFCAYLRSNKTDIRRCRPA